MNKYIKNNIASNNQIKMPHIQISKSEIESATIAIIPGDPHRSAILANMLDKNAKELNNVREFHSYLANVKNTKIVVISTGIGSPSTLICLEELAMLGIKKFIRIGTTGAIIEGINLGDIIITEGSVRLDPVTTHYAPLSYPAIVDFDLLKIFSQEFSIKKYPFHIGITASSGTFYPSQERYNSYSGYVIKKFQNSIEEWKKLNVINFEMESGALYLWTKIMGLKSICFSVVISIRDKSESLINYDSTTKFQLIINSIIDQIESINNLKN